MHTAANPVQLHAPTIQPWLKPPRGWWKINVDATIKTGEGIGLGMVIRDHMGAVIVVRCIWVSKVNSIEVAEGLACQEGLLLAREFGGTKMIVETDSQTIKCKLASKNDDLSYVGEVIRSVQMEALHLEDVIYSWARRIANMMAHSLARLAISSTHFRFYTGSIPDIVVEGLPSCESYVLI